MIANYRTLIPSLVAVVVMLISSITHQTISQTVQGNITNIVIIVITAGVSIWGIVKNHFNSPVVPPVEVAPTTPEQEAKG